jgi:hypothetical protein
MISFMQATSAPMVSGRTEGQEQTQIPCGNDKQKTNADPYGMTRRCRSLRDDKEKNGCAIRRSA